MNTVLIIAVARDTGIMAIVADEAGQPWFADIAERRLPDLMLSNPDWQYSLIPTISITEFEKSAK